MFDVRWEVLPMSEDNGSADRPPERRRWAVAAILARGVLRHRHAAKAAACPVPQESASSLENSLGAADRSSPCVLAGSGGYGPRERQERTAGMNIKRGRDANLRLCRSSGGNLAQVLVSQGRPNHSGGNRPSCVCRPFLHPHRQFLTLVRVDQCRGFDDSNEFLCREWEYATCSARAKALGIATCGSKLGESQRMLQPECRNCRLQIE